MGKYLDSVMHAYDERASLIILGLTGRTGSGCTTVANILKKEKFEQLDLRDHKTHTFSSKQDRKYEVVHKFMATNDRWQPFAVIEGSSIIFSFVLENGFQAFLDSFLSYINRDNDDGIRIRSFQSLEKIIRGLKYMFEDSDQYKLDELDEVLGSGDMVEKYYTYYTETIKKYKRVFQKSIDEFTCHKEILNKLEQTQTIKSHLYTYFMQKCGNNIRSSGNPYEKEYLENNFYNVAKRIDAIIRIICKYNEIKGIKSTRICIDAIRNSYEAYYFKDKYSSFYLMSINVEEDERRQRMGNLDEEERKSLDYIEYEESNKLDYSIFFHQDMQSCLAISDIHLYNPKSTDGKRYYITEGLLKYIALILHPGLITPTHIEHCMQTAYISKLNSGCLSRQVGAVITGEDYAIKAVGWNEVPEGQVPCNLRCISDYCANQDTASFSKFELENTDFQKALYKIKDCYSDEDLHGISYSYCFKDIYNAIKNDKNQVYTRALHAEENAFLQLSKNGGQGIKGGKLFTTASPCELCAKKAYQLGIKEIYYIEPYPGISEKHILSFGENKGPTMTLFTGVIGDAYIKLYTTRIPLKDEIKLLTGLNHKAIIHKKPEDGRKLLKNIKYNKISSKFEFKSRTDIRETIRKEITALRDNDGTFNECIAWSGNSLDDITLLHCSKKNSFELKRKSEPPYEAKLKLDKPLSAGDNFYYEFQVDVKDTQHIMNPYYAHLISVGTEALEMTLIAPKGMLSNVCLKVYADLQMTSELVVAEKAYDIIKTEESEEYRFTTNQVNLMYSYSFEWKFNEDYMNKHEN